MRTKLNVLAILPLIIFLAPSGITPADGIIFGQPEGHRDIAVTTADENQFGWDTRSHCLGGMVATDEGLKNPLGNEAGTIVGDSKNLFKPGDTVKISYNIWNTGGPEISDIPVSIGWFTYTANYKDKPMFMPINYSYTVEDLAPGQNIGIQTVEIKLPASFDGLPLVTGRMVKQRVTSVYCDDNEIYGLNDDDKFLSMAVIADPEKAISAWGHITSAKGGINMVSDEEIRLNNNIMVVLIPIME